MIIFLEMTMKVKDETLNDDIFLLICYQAITVAAETRALCGKKPISPQRQQVASWLHSLSSLITLC